MTTQSQNLSVYFYPLNPIQWKENPVDVKKTTISVALSS